MLARTYLCFDSRIVTLAVYGLSRLGLYRPVAEAIGLGRLTDLVSTLSVGGDGFAVTVEVDGQQNSTSKTLTMAIDGREQSRVTAIVAATVTLTIRDTTVPDGVHHVHEVLDPEPILDVLRERGYRLTNGEQVRETSESVHPNAMRRHR